MIGNVKRARRKRRERRRLFKYTVAVGLETFFRPGRWRTVLPAVAGRLERRRECVRWRRTTGMTAQLTVCSGQHFATACFVDALQPVTFVQLVVGLQNVTATTLIRRRHTKCTQRCTANTSIKNFHISTSNCHRCPKLKHTFVSWYTAPPAKYYYNTLLCCDYFSSSSVVSRSSFALCVYSKFGHHTHPLGYLCANFVSFAACIAELANGEQEALLMQTEPCSRTASWYKQHL